MRVQLAELQRRYKEKQRELARLQRRHDHEYGPGWQRVGGLGRGWGDALASGPGARGAQPSPGPPPQGQGSTCKCWAARGSGRPQRRREDEAFTQQRH